MAEPIVKGNSSVETGRDTANNEKETSVQQAGATSEKRGAEEKPQASEEIVIEEISIDGMCGVY